MLRWTSLIFCVVVLISSSILTARAQIDRGGSVRVREVDGRVHETLIYKRSYALLIGNSKYSNWNDLPGVSQDMTEVKDALKRNGFDVISFNDEDKPVIDQPALNLTRDSFSRQITRFIDEYGQDEENRLLIYYAGHGYTALLPDGRRMGYLVMRDAPSMPAVSEPLDRSLTTSQLSLFTRASINMDQIEAFAKSITSRHVLFVFDSCFAGTVLFRGGESSVASYITAEDLRPVRAFLTAGNEHEVVLDDGSFRQAFIRGIDGAADAADADHQKDGYVLGSELYAYIRKEVGRSTKNRQTPAFGKIATHQLARGDFIFIVRDAGRLAVAPAPTPAPTPIVLNARDAESVWWNTIQYSEAPDDFDKFLAAYPKGAYSQVAKFKREKLRRSAEISTYRNPKQGMTLSRPIAANIEMEFVGIPAGEFLMGAPPDEKNRVFRRNTQRNVQIKNGFWMGKYEVTEKQWKAVMKDKRSSENCNECPVNNLTWLEVKQFLQKLNERNDGFEYRLPSEAEWEYAARANTNTRFHWGDDSTQTLACSYANIRDNKAAVESSYLRELGDLFDCDDGHAGVAPVGKYYRNAFGLYDMIGNAEEWCEDVYSYDTNDSPNDGSPNVSKGDLNRRVQRGGSYFSGTGKYDVLSSASRSGGSVEISLYGAGFRVVVVPKGQ